MGGALATVERVRVLSVCCAVERMVILKPVR